MPNQFALDAARIRDDVRRRTQEGPVTATYGAEPVLGTLDQLCGVPGFDPAYDLADLLGVLG